MTGSKDLLATLQVDNKKYLPLLTSALILGSASPGPAQNYSQNAQDKSQAPAELQRASGAAPRLKGASVINEGHSGNCLAVAVKGPKVKIGNSIESPSRRVHIYQAPVSPSRHHRY